MGKIIAVFGAPDSGKTSTALNIAKEIYFTYKKSVLFISPDMTVPSLGYLFPNRKDSELFSLGAALDNTDIVRENILKQTVHTDKMENFGFLGFKAGEDRFTYPRPTEDKVSALFRCIRNIAAYSVVDCSNDTNDIISALSLPEAAMVFQIIKPDIKTAVYYTSNASRYVTDADKTVGVINISDRDIYLPVEDVKKSLKNVRYILPYCVQLKQQSITGTLTEQLTDMKYRTIIKEIVKEVL